MPYRMTAPHCHPLLVALTWPRSERVIIQASMIGIPLTNGTVIYWSSGIISEKGYFTTDEASGANNQAATVISSSWKLPSVSRSTTLVVDTQTEFDALVSTTQVFTNNSELQIPDIAEGSQEVTPVVGSQFIIAIANGAGTATLRPRGVSTFTYNSTTYTNASPLVLDGSNGDQYIVVTVGANSYTGGDLNKGGINTLTWFNSNDHNERTIINAVFANGASIGTNSADISTLENWPLITVNNADYNGGGTNARKNVVVTMDSLSQDRTFTLGAYADYGLTGQQTLRFKIHNTSGTYWVEVINHATNGDFAGMGVDRFWIGPNETREIVIELNGGSYQVYPMGPVTYDFAYDFSLWNGTGGGYTWTQAGLPLPSGLIEIDPSRQERLNLPLDCAIEALRLDGNFIFLGTAAADFASLATLNPSVQLEKSGLSVETFHPASLTNLANSQCAMHNELDIVVANAADYLELQGVSFTDVNMATATMRGTIVLKKL